MHCSPSTSATWLVHPSRVCNATLFAQRPLARGVSLLLMFATALPSQASAAQALAAAPAGDEALPTVTDEPEPPKGENVRDDDSLARAMDAFARGSENYNKAEYQAALSDFREAATLYASPDFQYNIALCYEKLDKPEEAIGAFETYLKTKKDIPDRANVEDRIRRLRTMLETGEMPPPATKPDETPPPAVQKNTWRPFIISGATLTALGAAVALGGGIGLGIAAKGKSDDLDDALDPGTSDPITFDEASDLESDGKRLELGQIVIVAVGGAVALTGVALLAVGLSRKSKAKAGNKAAAHLRFSPGWTRGGAGLSLAGRF